MCEFPKIACQISFYPLRTTDIDTSIEKVLELIQRSGLFIEIGEMSTIVKGNSCDIFQLLENITTSMDKQHCKFSMSIILSNDCGCAP